MKEKIKNFIVETFMFGEGNVEDDDQLFQSGKIDWLGFIKLLSFIENELNVRIDMSEVSMDKFATINDIVATVESKLSS